MFKPYQRHPFEVRLAHVLIAFFTLAVLGGFYYTFGGPIPYLINWNGPRGEAFTGRYEVLGTLPPNPEEALASGRTFEATYPYTVMVWGGAATTPARRRTRTAPRRLTASPCTAAPWCAARRSAGGLKLAWCVTTNTPTKGCCRRQGP